MSAHSKCLAGVARASTLVLGMPTGKKKHSGMIRLVIKGLIGGVFCLFVFVCLFVPGISETTGCSQN